MTPRCVRPLRALAAAALCPALVIGVSPAALAHPVALAGTWGKAQEVPGTAALNEGGSAGISAISCPSAGDCGAVGEFTGFFSGDPKQQVFVADEKNGTWGTAQELPSLENLNIRGPAIASTVSCPLAGNCGAGGSYGDFAGHPQAFVVDETNGTWGTAIEVPGLAALNTGNHAQVVSESCPSPGNCTATGTYSAPTRRRQVPFIVTEKNGTWGTAKKVPGLSTLLSPGGGAIVGQVSCRTVGNCSIGGSTDLNGAGEAWVASETNGTWRPAIQVPGITALDQGAGSSVESLSCASPGNCSGSGFYENSTQNPKAFVVDETNGTWGTAIAVPGIAALSTSFSDLALISCTSLGNCSGAGSYEDSTHNQQPFVVDETNGTWGAAQEVPGTGALNPGGSAQVSALSCGAPGDCSAGGVYGPSHGTSFQAFVVTETNGTWGNAIAVPGLAALNTAKIASLDALSCGGPGNCSAGGAYAPSRGTFQAFVVNER